MSEQIQQFEYFEGRVKLNTSSLPDMSLYSPAANVFPFIVTVHTFDPDGSSQIPPKATTVPPVTVILPSQSTEPAIPPCELPPFTSVNPPVIAMLPFESSPSVSPLRVVTSRYPPFTEMRGEDFPAVALTPSSFAFMMTEPPLTVTRLPSRPSYDCSTFTVPPSIFSSPSACMPSSPVVSVSVPPDTVTFPVGVAPFSRGTSLFACTASSVDDTSRLPPLITTSLSALTPLHEYCVPEPEPDVMLTQSPLIIPDATELMR